MIVDKIRFDFSTMKWKNLTSSQIDIWQRIYPDISVIDEVTLDMVRWLDANAGTKKVKKTNWKKFIVNWLKRAQARALGMA